MEFTLNKELLVSMEGVSYIALGLGTNCNGRKASDSKEICPRSNFFSFLERQRENVSGGRSRGRGRGRILSRLHA